MRYQFADDGTVKPTEIIEKIACDHFAPPFGTSGAVA
jgi:hypothetical protein